MLSDVFLCVGVIDLALFTAAAYLSIAHQRRSGREVSGARVAMSAATPTLWFIAAATAQYLGY